MSEAAPAAAALIVIPARNERRRVPDCLAAAIAAARCAVEAGAVAEARIVLVAHRCEDDTAAIARTLLAARIPGDARVRWDVVEDGDSETVGAVRALGVAAALALGPLEAERTWLCSTDADSIVPPDWILAYLEELAARPGAVGARGLVELAGWRSSEEARRRYDALIAAGMRPDDHDHVYGANLIVRLDAYLAAGGFPDVMPGEDHLLWAALRERGGWMPGVPRPFVRTAGRTTPRAAGGLGDLLIRLGRGEEADGEVARSAATVPGSPSASALAPASASAEEPA